MARVLIAGCGDVGTRLGLVLASNGHEVYGLRRRPEALPAGIEGVAGDLADPPSLSALPEAVDYLLYTAAADAFTAAAYRTAYVEGPRGVIRHVKRTSPALRRVLFVSSTSVYAQDAGEWVDEDSRTEPRGFSGQCLLEGESVVAAGGVSAVSVRFGGIYGPGRERLIERVRAGAPCTADPPAYTNRIHADDCAGVLAHLMGLGSPAPVYVGVDCAPAAQCEVMDWLAARLSVPAPQRAAAASGRARGNKRCRNARLLASGYRFSYPSFKEGYDAVLAYRSDG